MSLDEHKRRERAQAIGLFRYRLICPALDEGLSTKQRGKLVREIAAEPHADPFGNQVRISRETLDRWIRRYRRAVRAYDIATAAWALIFAARYLVQSQLYDSDHTWWLAIARIGMGWPLTGLALLVTIWAVRRADRIVEPGAAAEPAASIDTTRPTDDTETGSGQR